MTTLSRNLEFYREHRRAPTLIDKIRLCGSLSCLDLLVDGRAFVGQPLTPDELAAVAVRRAELQTAKRKGK